MSKKKIGLLLRSCRVDPYVAGIAEKLGAEPGVELRLVVHADASALPNFATAAPIERGPRGGSAAARLLLRLVRGVEGAVLRLCSARVRAHSTRRDLRRGAGASARAARPERLVRHAHGNIESIARERFDLLIAAEGLDGWPADIAACAKHGVVGVHFGDYGQDDAASAGFREVCFRQPSTRFVIRLATPEHTEGRVVLEGRVSTQRIWLLNAEHVCREAAFYLRRAVTDYVATGVMRTTDAAPPQPPPRAAPTVRDTGPQPPPRAAPTVRDTGRYVRSVAAFYADLAAKRLLYRRRQRWSVAYARGEWTSCALGQGVVIDNAPGHFYADPFLVEHEGRCVCFVEDYCFARERGRIAALEIDETGARMLGPVIEEDFHMSFPYVFWVDGDLYMAPETCEKREVRVYKCSGFPMRWEYHCTLMSGVPAVDPMILERGGKWWLLVNIAEGDSTDLESRLFVYHADSPFSTDWIPVGNGPVLFDPEIARNGGLLEADGALYRVAQTQGFDTYGVGLRIRRIEELSERGYTESEFRVVRPDFFAGIDGCHHMHSAGSYTVYDCFRSERVGKVRSVPSAPPRRSRVPVLLE